MTCRTAAPATGPQPSKPSARRTPDAVIELLIPDLDARGELLDTVLASKPDIVGHNIETVERLTPLVRSRARYRTSLETLRLLAERGAVTKSGLMVGLGESDAEVLQTLHDLRDAGVRIVTLGQYLRPTLEHYPVAAYISPEKFERYRLRALEMGFSYCASAPSCAPPTWPEEALRSVRGTARKTPEGDEGALRDLGSMEYETCWKLQQERLFNALLDRKRPGAGKRKQEPEQGEPEQGVGPESERKRQRLRTGHSIAGGTAAGNLPDNPGRSCWWSIRRSTRSAKSGHAENLLISREAASKPSGHGSFHRPRRGHHLPRPRQLVCYPILDLERLGIGLREYIDALEEAVIRTVAGYGIEAGRIAGASGVWIDPGKARPAQDLRNRSAIFALCYHARTGAQRHDGPRLVLAHQPLWLYRPRRRVDRAGMRPHRSDE